MKQFIVKNGDGSIEIHRGKLRLRDGQTLHAEVGESYPLPAKDKFRNAWRLSRGQVKINMAEARKLKKSELMALKDSKMAENAAEFNLKLSLAEDTSEIAAKQQTLNSIEEKIDADLAKRKSVSTIDAYDPFGELGL